MTTKNADEFCSAFNLAKLGADKKHDKKRQIFDRFFVAQKLVGRSCATNMANTWNKKPGDEK